jgi:iron complex outermembrane recepter protein
MYNSGPGQTEIEIRGVDAMGGNSPTTGFYIGDTPLTAPAGANDGKVVIDPSLYDLNRVEVLRGPQGTLYGASSMGGTVRLIPNDPNPDAFDAGAQGIVSGTDGGGANGAVNAMLNLPLLNGRAALRLVGSEQYTSGWIDRIVLAPGDFPPPADVRGTVSGVPIAADHKDANDEKLTAGRATLLWNLTDSLTVTPMVFSQLITMDMPNYFDSVPGTLAHYQPFDIAEPYSDRFNMESLNVAYKTPVVEVNSNTSYWDRSSAQVRDASEVIAYLVGAPSVYLPEGGTGAVAFRATDTSHQFSQEIRIASAGQTRFTWLAGAFYSKFESISSNMSTEPDLVSFFGTSDLFWKSLPTRIEQTAVFGELSYEMLPGLRATAGLREYHYDTDFQNNESGAFGPTGTDQVSTYSTQASDRGVTPKYDISYHPNKDLMVYATVAKGFRPGGGNQVAPTTGPTGDSCNSDLHALGLSAEPAAFKSDSLWSYEVGEKARLLNGNLTLNAAVYRIDWNGVQQSVSLNCGFGFTANAGAARIYGGEVETEAVLMEGLVASASVGYSHAYVSQGSAGAGTVDGDPIQNAPLIVTNVGLTYTRPLAAGLDLVSHIENSYVARRYEPAVETYTPVSPYSLTNGRVGVRLDHWQASLFANNLFNKRAWLSIADTEVASIPAYNNIATNQPRTIGLDASYRFR